MAWLLPTAGFIITAGMLGVASKVAMRSLDWAQLVVLTAIPYALMAAALLVAGQGAPRWTPDMPWGIVAGLMPLISLIMLLVALGHGSASVVVPASSTYPVVTALLALVLLGERISALQLAGMALVVVGVVLLSR